MSQTVSEGRFRAAASLLLALTALHCGGSAAVPASADAAEAGPADAGPQDAGPVADAGCNASCSTVACGSVNACGVSCTPGSGCCADNCGSFDCGAPNACGRLCVSNTGCSYQGCAQSQNTCHIACGHCLNIPNPGESAKCEADCLAACNQMHAACCAQYVSQNPSDECD
jgi:hypothetical protein